MSKPLHQFFTEDHHGIDTLLSRAHTGDDNIRMEYYLEFRIRLLTHIKMEEKILFPAAKKENETLMRALIPRYRLEHGALTALMVPPPTKSLITAIRYVLEQHDLAEEEPGGLYDICENLTKGQSLTLLDQLKLTEPVPVHPLNPAPIALESAIRALERAGYQYDAIIRDTRSI